VKVREVKPMEPEVLIGQALVEEETIEEEPVEEEEVEEETVTAETVSRRGRRTIKRKKGTIYVYNVVTGEVVAKVPAGTPVEYDLDTHMLFLVHVDKYSIRIKLFKVPKILKQDLTRALRMALNAVKI
jgi:hypothetical protein